MSSDKPAKPSSKLIDMRLDHIYNKQIKKMDAAEEILSEEMKEIRRRTAMYEDAIQHALARKKQLEAQREADALAFEAERAAIADFYYDTAKKETEWEAELKASLPSEPVAEKKTTVKKTAVKKKTVATPATKRVPAKKKPVIVGKPKVKK